MGRFTQEDPIGDGLNWYTYCINNPIKFIDPAGLSIKISGDEEFRKSTLKDLQKLTDKFLKFDEETGLVVEGSMVEQLVYDIGKAIISVITGYTPPKKEYGTSLVSELIKHERNVEIIYTKDHPNPGESYAFGFKPNGSNWAYASNEVGMDAIIYFDPNAKFITKSTYNGSTWEMVPSPIQIALGHELIHSYYTLTGFSSLPASANSYTNLLGETVTLGYNEYVDEFYTIGLPGYDSRYYTENKLRREQVCPLRVEY